MSSLSLRETLTFPKHFSWRGGVVGLVFFLFCLIIFFSFPKNFILRPSYPSPLLQACFALRWPTWDVAAAPGVLSPAPGGWSPGAVLDTGRSPGYGISPWKVLAPWEASPSGLLRPFLPIFDSQSRVTRALCDRSVTEKGRAALPHLIPCRKRSALCCHCS